MKKILITHFYTRENGGDAGILQGAVQELATAFPGSALTVHTMEQVSDGLPVPPVVFMKSYFYWAVYAPFLNVFTRAIRTAYILCYTTLVAALVAIFGNRALWLLPGKLRRVMYDYAHADLILPIGGGYLTAKNSVQGTITTLLQLHAICIALILQKPVVLLAQSVGPYATSFQKFLVRIVLNRVNAIFVRENFSNDFLKSIGVIKPHIALATDSAFLCSFPTPAPATQPARAVVAITARRWYAPAAQQQYEHVLADFADWLVNDVDCDVHLVPQVIATTQNDNDSAVLTRVLQYSKNAMTGRVVLLPNPAGLSELWGWYGGFHAVVGTRMHSVIFALTHYVPCIAIGYEYKTKGIMDALGLDPFVVPIDNCTLQNLQQLYRKIEAERAQYEQTLRANLPQYIDSAKKPFQYLKTHYGTAHQ